MLSFTGRLANFEDWYGAIKEYTPESTYFKLSSETKQVLIATTFDKMSEQIMYFSEMNDRPNTDGLDETQLLKELVAEMDKHIKGRELFFRTNLFSPKDVGGSCFVSSGKEALDMLQSSYRLYKGYKDLLEDKDLYVVFRTKVDYKEEFRCFVEEGHIKGISQYDDSNAITEGDGAYAIYEYKNSDYIDILNYVEEVVSRAGIIDSVLDIGVTPEGLSTIELNPYGNITDKSLFAESDIYERELDKQTEVRYWTAQHTLCHIWIENNVVVREEVSDLSIQSISKVEENDLDTLMASLKRNLKTPKHT